MLLAKLQHIVHQPSTPKVYFFTSPFNLSNTICACELALPTLPPAGMHMTDYSKYQVTIQQSIASSLQWQVLYTHRRLCP